VKNTLLSLVATGALLLTSLSASADTIEKLQESLPGITKDQISASPVKGVYQLDLNDKFAYVTEDGNYLFTGELVDLEAGVNISQLQLGKKRVSKIAAIPDESFIVFPAKEKKYSVTVFTDIDCSWCRRFHEEIEDYNSKGIEVRYLLRPRSGPQAKSWQKADTVFCSKNQQRNLTKAKQGQEVSAKKCDKTPTMSNVALAQELGFMGTPVVLTEGGQYVGGYVAPAELLQKLQAEKSAGS